MSLAEVANFTTNAREKSRVYAQGFHSKNDAKLDYIKIYEMFIRG